MGFFKTFFASLLALVVFSIIAFFLFIGVIAAIGTAFSDDTQVVLEENGVLYLKLDGPITEQQKENPLSGLPIIGNEAQNVGLIQLKQSLDHAKLDPKIKGIYLDISSPTAGFSTLQEIRLALSDFRKSGKWVISYSETMSEGAYYLASAADKVYLYPEGEIEFNGLTVEVSFFKKLFDKLEIKPEIFRVGEFKSAVEPFILDKMSEPNRLQLTQLIGSIYGQVLQGISESRNIPKERLKEISDKMLVRNAKAALDLGLVDSLVYNDELHAVIKSKLGIDGDKEINFIKYSKYQKSFSTNKTSENEVAVIVAEGTIMPGKSEQSDQVIGADSYVKEIRKARENKNIKAIVLRINSPGGEFKASDMMWREITLTAKVKPIIASMGDYAASGGYYMAMGCNTIVAQPNTITGSIGIFGMMFDMSGFFENKLGVTFDQVKTGEFGELYTVTRPLNDAEKNFMQNNLNDYYDTFTGKAAAGRHMSIDAIKKVASGRVWTGEQAKEVKLVDELGSFDDAIRIASEKANVSADYKVKYYPEQKPFFEQLMTQWEDNTKADAIKAELGEYYIWYNQIQHLKTYQGAQARMPFELQIH